MRLERIARMPNWPARMDDDMAANFLGIGVTKFREKVKSGEYPQPVEEEGRKLWSCLQLERFVNAQFGLPVDATPRDGASGNSWGDL